MQPRLGYRAAIDPVFLAAALHSQPGQRVLDLGCGVGTAALCLLARLPESQVTGLELQPDLAALARENAALNGMGSRFTILQGDLRDPPAGLEAGGFDHVMTNPPFVAAGRARPSPNACKATANMEGSADLNAWTAFCARMLKPKGRLTLIHRADRLDALLACLHGLKLGEVAVFPLWPKAGRAAKRVIVTARKGVNGPSTLLPGLVLHDEDGRYSEAAEVVLRHGGGLEPMGGLAKSSRPPTL
ncbi:tRNA1(Val) (adenine(37)-N6)-methyltransferase [Telmatospirillum sp. J64-1]|uniref:tRNA1(Val) (adenine(37)-N6)-methyltransferase n=1 Tax=Telmatospirillum sp. J64-1 TaxID=2502183 RepID=UPI002104CB79|nr:methyltransferase [Telmatospirillum sp. J64-1]